MRGAVAALVAAGALLSIAGPAIADVRRAQLGDVSATLSLKRHAGYSSGLRLVVVRAGAVVYSGALTTAAGRPGSLRDEPRVRDFLGVRLRVLDLDGDGVGEAIVDLAERGSYCCSHSVIVGAVSGSERPLELDWGSYGSAGEPVRAAGASLLVGRDARLEERFTPHVLSFEPVRVWSYRSGAVTDVSAQQPAIVGSDLSQLLAERSRLLRRPDHATIDLRGLLTAIAGDRMLLGRTADAERSLRADVAAGRVQASFPPALRALLGRLGY